MQPARIVELLAPFLDLCHSDQRNEEESAPLSSAQLRNISTYIDILLLWNAQINLTSIRDEDEIVTRHFGESFFAARHLFPEKNREGHDFSRADRERAGRGAFAPESIGRPKTLADLGSGAGFPGIPIKLWAPEISLTLIESNHRKVAFLREVARALTLTDINILSARAESLAPEKQRKEDKHKKEAPEKEDEKKFDVITLRAVEHFASILPVAARLLTPSGRLALLIGSAQIPRAHATLPGFAWSDRLPIPSSQSRVLLVGKSVLMHES